jgi:hypothetical protein
MVTLVITVGWAIALVVVLILRSSLPGNERWWVWTCVAGLAMGLFGLWYVPRLKRSRAKTAERRAAERAGAGPAAAPSADGEAADDTPPSRKPASA